MRPLKGDLSWKYCLLLLLTVSAVYYGIYGIPFLYTEVGGIQRNPIVLSAEALGKHLLKIESWVFRPLSIISYYLNHTLFGGRAWAFHAVNLLIHFVNVLLVFRLSRLLRLNAYVASAVFALHPMATACVSQIYGRNYSLATIFLLLGLIVYRKGFEERFTKKNITALSALFILMVSSKQSLVFFPFILGWHWVSFGKKARTSPVLFAVIGTVIAVTTTFVLAYAIPLSHTAPVGSFSYLLSQLGNLIHLAGMYTLPFQTSFLHELPFYRSMGNPNVLIGLALVMALLYVIFRTRGTMFSFLLGAWVLSIAPTNSILAKNEIIREWRLYPSLVFYSLLLGLLASIL